MKTEKYIYLTIVKIFLWGIEENMNKNIVKILEASVIIFIVIISSSAVGTCVDSGKNYLKLLTHSEKTEGLPYEGHLRIYVVEPVSRWIHNDGNPYHFGFLDFAFDDTLSIEYQDTYEDRIVWDGNDAGYGDIQEDNIMVIAVVFNPERHQGYAYPPSTNPFDAYYVDAAAAATPGNTGNNTVNENFTHTVFCEEATAPWCGYCVYARDALQNIYESHDYPFYFVALIADVGNEAAEQRLFEDYNLYGFPTCFFDGGYKTVIGGYPGVENTYRNEIENCGQRDVHELNLTVSLEWLGNGAIQIHISITNNEVIDKPIVEIENIKGGFGVTATIKNTGTKEATDVEWSMSIKGGILGLINISTNGVIDALPVNESRIIKTGSPLFGLGKITITVTADEKEKTVNGFILLFLIIIPHI
ncbi:MAG: hypothetical protein DRN05_03785 [Thermoplasmata archaeon]|nr:MAG: hypothetical protein DRN05_03785 [Thermoplasmata archaeon]